MANRAWNPVRAYRRVRFLRHETVMRHVRRTRP
jgi:hypothetical protein